MCIFRSTPLAVVPHNVSSIPLDFFRYCFPTTTVQLSLLRLADRYFCSHLLDESPGQMVERRLACEIGSYIIYMSSFEVSSFLRPNTRQLHIFVHCRKG